MQQCPGLEGCPFFNDKMANMPATVEMMKRSFCLGHFDGCARYMVASALGREAVPGDLFPSHHKRADELILKAS